MDPKTRADFALAVLPPLITAVVAALGLFFAERRKDRDQIQRRLKAIGEETLHLSYLRSWLETQQLASGTDESSIATARQEVCAELASSRVRLCSRLQDLPEPDGPPALMRAWRKAALIPLDRPLARVVGWAYRLCLMLGVLCIAMIVFQDYREVEGLTFGVALSVGILFFLPFLIAALGLRTLALALDRRGASNRRRNPMHEGPQNWQMPLHPQFQPPSGPPMMPSFPPAQFHPEPTGTASPVHP